MNCSVVPTGASRSEAKRRDLVSLGRFFASGNKVPRLRFASLGTTVVAALLALLPRHLHISGRQAGQFHWVHALAIDSKGNVYTGEVDNGKRVQKFKPDAAPK